MYHSFMMLGVRVKTSNSPIFRESTNCALASSLCKLQAYLRDIVGLVPHCSNKANTTIKRVAWICLFPSAQRS